MANKFFSIGKLSKLTGIHIQSLRYYEELGILKPAYIDPSTSYRYYAFFHVRIVEAIQYCVDLGIPLKQFPDFLKENCGEIDYSKLIDYGTEITKQKMLQIQNRLHFLEGVQKEIAHAEECISNDITKAFLPEKVCWTLPYDGTQSDPDFHSAMYKLISDIENHGLKAGYNNGQIMVVNKTVRRSYLFIDIKEAGKNPDAFPQIMKIPAGNYLSVISKESRVHKAPEIFREQFSKDYDKFIVEVELFTGTFHYTEPVYELRCNLP